MTSSISQEQATKRAATVSVVIPTRNRPAMVRAAVESAFAQTVRPFEVIVVVDGAENGSEPDTARVLAALGEPGLQLLSLPVSAGGAGARNRGVEAALGDWIAFLDDDDLWLPDKLARQLAAAALQPDEREPVIACRVVARSPEWEEVWPRTAYRAGEPMGEYLFCRRGWRYGDALLQTSTLLAPRKLLLRLPFTEGLPRHQDWDWLLRAAADPSVAIQCVEGEPLAVFHVEGERSSVSRIRDWRFSVRWAQQHRALLGRRGMRGFLATECAAQAQSAGWRERVELLRILLRYVPASGPGAAADVFRAMLFLLVGQQRRRALRDIFRPGSRLRGGALKPV